MDALPIQETSDLPFKSLTGNMHACGHDIHTSILLGAAKLLKDHEDEINGQVKLMFQPAEETLRGAKTMIDAGLLENPKVDAALMIHVASGMPLPSGAIMVVGENMRSAAADWFKITVQGKGGHGAMPNLGVDPLNISTHIFLALQNINSREVPPGEPTIVTVGSFHGGSVANVIPDTATLEGTIRTLDAENRSLVKERVRSIAEKTAEVFCGEQSPDSGRFPAAGTQNEHRV